VTSPTQVALRELMILTKCYCDGEHPRLGHNCSFRPDVMTLVANIGAVLELLNDGRGDGVWEGFVEAEKVRAALLGVPMRSWPADDPPWNQEVPADALLRDPGSAAYSGQIAERLQRAEESRRLSEQKEGPSATG